LGAADEQIGQCEGAGDNSFRSSVVKALVGLAADPWALGGSMRNVIQSLTIAVVIAGCASSAASINSAVSGDLERAIAHRVLVHAVDWNVAADTSSWYWTFDTRGFSDGVAKSLAARVEQAVPATTLDTVAARGRYMVRVYPPRIAADSASVSVLYMHSWIQPCTWGHSSASYTYRFRNISGSWSYMGRDNPIIGDPAPPPPPGDSRNCRERQVR
jgi:hypothetical protein